MASSLQPNVYRLIRRGECLTEGCECNGYIRDYESCRVECTSCQHVPTKHQNLGHVRQALPEETQEVVTVSSRSSTSSPEPLDIPLSELLITPLPQHLRSPQSASPSISPFTLPDVPPQVHPSTQGTTQRKIGHKRLPEPAPLAPLSKHTNLLLKNRLKPLKIFTGKEDLSKFLESISEVVTELEPKEWLTLLIINLQFSARDWFRLLKYDWTFDYLGVEKCKSDLYKQFPQHPVAYDSLLFIQKHLKHASAFNSWLIKFEGHVTILGFTEELKTLQLIICTKTALSLDSIKLAELSFEEVVKKLRKTSTKLTAKSPSSSSQQSKNQMNGTSLPSDRNRTQCRFREKCRDPINCKFTHYSSEETTKSQSQQRDIPETISTIIIQEETKIIKEKHEMILETEKPKIPNSTQRDTNTNSQKISQALAKELRDIEDLLKTLSSQNISLTTY